MSRPLRIEFEGAWYHVMNRGAGGKNIFHSANQCKLFLDLLGETHRKFKIEIHAYCLMSNHYHLMIRTPIANLHRAMRHLNGVYTQHFNRKQKSDGSLFRGRYKAILVDADSYLLQLNRYIHLNPVTANLCDDPEDYKWSSYSVYIGKTKKPEWLFIKEVLQRFDIFNQTYNYRLFINEGIDINTANFYKKLRKTPLLGDDKFVNSIIQKYLKHTPLNREIPEHKIILQSHIPTVEHVIRIVSQHYNVSINTITSSKRGSLNKPRSIAIYIATLTCQLTLTEIAKCFGQITRLGISNAYRRVLRTLEKDEDLKHEIEVLIEMANPS